MIQLKPGVFNFSDLIPAQAAAARPAAAKPAPPGLALPFSLQAGKIAIKDGLISYQDRTSAAQWRVSDFQAAINNLSSPSPSGSKAA